MYRSSQHGVSQYSKDVQCLQAGSTQPIHREQVLQMQALIFESNPKGGEGEQLRIHLLLSFPSWSRS